MKKTNTDINVAWDEFEFLLQSNASMSSGDDVRLNQKKWRMLGYWLSRHEDALPILLNDKKRLEKTPADYLSVVWTSVYAPTLNPFEHFSPGNFWPAGVISTPEDVNVFCAAYKIHQKQKNEQGEIIIARELSVALSKRKLGEIIFDPTESLDLLTKTLSSKKTTWEKTEFLRDLLGNSHISDRDWSTEWYDFLTKTPKFAKEKEIVLDYAKKRLDNAASNLMWMELDEKNAPVFFQMMEGFGHIPKIPWAQLIIKEKTESLLGFIKKYAKTPEQKKALLPMDKDFRGSDIKNQVTSSGAPCGAIHAFFSARYPLSADPSAQSRQKYAVKNIQKQMFRYLLSTTDNAIEGPNLWKTALKNKDLKQDLLTLAFSSFELEDMFFRGVLSPVNTQEKSHKNHVFHLENRQKEIEAFLLSKDGALLPEILKNTVRAAWDFALTGSAPKVEILSLKEAPKNKSKNIEIGISGQEQDNNVWRVFFDQAAIMRKVQMSLSKKGKSLSALPSQKRLL